jgi:hypothetical protein
MGDPTRSAPFQSGRSSTTEWYATLWLAPSVPFEELSDRPRYKVRYAELPDTNGVVIFY